MTKNVCYGIIMPNLFLRISMSSQSIELSVLGQVLRLNCQEDQVDALRQAARH